MDVEVVCMRKDLLASLVEIIRILRKVEDPAIENPNFFGESRYLSLDEAPTVGSELYRGVPAASGVFNDDSDLLSRCHACEIAERGAEVKLHTP